MNHQYREYLITFFVVILLFSACIDCSTIIVEESEINDMEVDFANSSFTISNPISILNDADFAEQALDNSWPGDGTENTPYIISRLNITRYSDSMPLINIRNTSVCFEIEGNHLVGGSSGILLQEVINGTILNNTLYHSYGSGIYLMDCTNCRIMNNSISENNGRGILADYSEFCQVDNNTIQSNSFAGVNLRDSPNNVIVRNRIVRNTGDGILLGNSPSCEIICNHINNNSHTGVSVEISTPAQITNNSIYFNIETGLVIGGASLKSTISGNTFYQNGHWAIWLDANRTWILRNNFIENCMHYGVGHVAINVAEFVFSENYYDDWTYPDANNDQTVDEPYFLDWDRSYSDEYPRVFAYQNYELDVLTRPLIAFPHDTPEPNYQDGLIDITWGPSSDTCGHEIEYSVEYSTAEVDIWDAIASNLSTTHYLWNSSIVPQGVDYIIRVRAFSSCGLTRLSQMENNFTILPHTISEPTILGPSEPIIDFYGIDIHWTLSNDSWECPVNYSLSYRPLGETDWILLFTDIPDSQAHVEIGTLTDGTYEFLVVAYSSCGLSSQDTIQVIVQANAVKILRNLLYVAIVLSCVIAVVFVFYKRRKV